MNERERRISEKLGFRIQEEDGCIGFCDEKGGVGFTPGQSRYVIKLWRELLSTTEQLERIRKAAQRAAGEFEEILSYCAVEKDPILRKQELKSIREVREALRKELL